MKTKQLTYPTIEEQQQYWINKETLDNPEAQSNNATTETREELIESTVDKIEQYATIHDFTQVGHCVREAIDQGIQNFLCGNASNLSKSEGTTAEPKPETDDLSRTEATAQWFDGLADTYWSLRDEGRNPDGSGMSYGERNG